MSNDTALYCSSHNIELTHLSLHSVPTHPTHSTLKHSVDVFDTSVCMMTPLMDAIEEGHIDAAALLVQSGASLSIQDVRGENSMHYAARQTGRMIRALISASTYNPAQVQSVCAVPNMKLQFPEDVASSSITQGLLVTLRERGVLPPQLRQQQQQQRNRQPSTASATRPVGAGAGPVAVVA